MLVHNDSKTLRISYFLVVLSLLGLRTVVAEELKLTFENINDFAKTRVFKINVKPPGGGSAVLLAVREENGQQFAYFGTCYHVLSGSIEFSIFDFEQNLVANHKNEDVRILRRWNQDLVIIRVRLDKKLKLNPVDPKKVVPPDKPSALSRPIEGFAIGFPGFERDRLVPLRVRVEGMQYAEFMDILDLKAKRPTGDDTDLRAMKVRFLVDEETRKGMSGGLIVDSQGRFGGLILGKTPDACLISPSEIILAALEVPTKEYKPYNPDIFRSPPPYTTEVTKHMLKGASNEELSKVIDLRLKELQAALDRERQQSIQLLKAASGAAALADFFAKDNPEIQRIASILKNAVNQYDGEPNDPRIRLAKASIAFVEKRYRDVPKIFSKEDAEPLAGFAASGFRLLGNSHLEIEQFDSALEYYHRAQEIEPDNYINTERLGVCFKRPRRDL
jgi:hypothetical protein